MSSVVERCGTHTAFNVYKMTIKPNVAQVCYFCCKYRFGKDFVTTVERFRKQIFLKQTFSVFQIKFYAYRQCFCEK